MAFLPRQEDSTRAVGVAQPVNLVIHPHMRRLDVLLTVGFVQVLAEVDFGWVQDVHATSFIAFLRIPLQAIFRPSA